MTTTRLERSLSLIDLMIDLPESKSPEQALQEIMKAGGYEDVKEFYEGFRNFCSSLHKGVHYQCSGLLISYDLGILVLECYRDKKALTEVALYNSVEFPLASSDSQETASAPALDLTSLPSTHLKPSDTPSSPLNQTEPSSVADRNTQHADGEDQSEASPSSLPPLPDLLASQDKDLDVPVHAQTHHLLSTTICKEAIQPEQK